MMCRNFSVSSIPVRFPVLFTAIACLAVCSWLGDNVFRGRKQSKEHDYISEFTLTNRPKSVCRFCEDIANVRHLFMFYR